LIWEAAMPDLVGEVDASALDHPDAKWPADHMADEVAAMRLLAGFDESHPEAVSYLAINSPEEKQARAALARIVRREMRGFVGELLALAIDPDTPTKSATLRPCRRIRFESPARGKPVTWARDLLIVGTIKELLCERGNIEATLYEVENKYGLQRSQIYAIWRKYHRAIEERAKSK
jgi:hypothetical protein